MSGKQQPFADRQRARRRALQSLYQWQLTGQDIKDIQRQFCEEQDMSTVDVDFFNEIGRQVVEHQDELDADLLPFLERDAATLDPLERAVLWIGAYELKHHRYTPYRVVIKEAVDLAARFASEQGHAFVNGVLDRAARKLRAEEYAEQAKES